MFYNIIKFECKFKLNSKFNLIVERLRKSKKNRDEKKTFWTYRYFTLHPHKRTSVSALCKYCTDKHGKLDLTYLPVQKQQDGHTCGLFAVAFAAEVVADKSPVEASFIVKEMRSHLNGCLEIQELTPFPKTNMDL